MIGKVRSYIRKFQLLSDDDRPVLVGLSGGADSVALLDILNRLGYTCVALHCDFHLRGEESEGDADFSARFAKSLEVPFYKADFDTMAYAKEKRISIEMAARELRYVWFEDMRVRLGGQAIAVAHHRDDSVETILMNLIRGTGIRGMRGIRAKNGYVTRPLLCVSRKEIENWLLERGYGYRTDRTNLSDAYTRNFIRLNVLPLLEKLNPSVREAIARSAEHLSAAEKMYAYVLEQARREVVSGNRISIKALMRFPAPDTILYEILRDYGFSNQVAGEVFGALLGESGKFFYSPAYRLLKDRSYLWLTPIGEIADEREYPLELGKDSYERPIRLNIQTVARDGSFSIPKDKRVACLDYDKLSFPLTLRTWREGDWFIPFGMRGRKKLSDYFSDHKFSRVEKENAWLLCGGGEIIWLVGERIDNRFRIDDTTKHVLLVNFLG